ncbi:MAG: formylglycine-generating enzyme family protein [Planctomycetota bacterium]|jgi:formylglycine-generating enzyme required for sulfatase activity
MQRPSADPRTTTRTAAAIVAAILGGPALADGRTPDDPPRPVASSQFTQTIPGTSISFDMMPVRGGAVEVPGPDGAAGERVEVAPFWIGRTEITWDAFDVFVFGLDQLDKGATDGGSDPDGPDAVTRPSKPYISMDRGFGHAGYPAISMSYKGAEAFCAWLSVRTGKRYRLPTEAEWLLCCRESGIDPADPGPHAWHRANARYATHPVGSKPSDALGLQDLHGNAAEWCTGADGRPVTLGGSYRDPADGIGCAARVEPTPDWNASDPQVPKSVWWLADGGFVGFRVVCEGETENDEPADDRPEGQDE